jgi:hypothetical protein
MENIEMASDARLSLEFSFDGVRGALRQVLLTYDYMDGRWVGLTKV